jgi:hypothetical protein
VRHAKQHRTVQEVDELVELARQYCESRAAVVHATADGRLSPQQQEASSRRLEILNRRIELLKSNNELDRQRARRECAVISLAEFQKVAK